MDNKTKFREALTNEERIGLMVKELGHGDLTGLLVKFGGLEQLEADEIKVLHRESTRDQLRAIISRIVEKDSDSAYIGLSKVIHYKNNYVWQRVFPFGPEHSKLLISAKRGSPQQNVHQSQAPDSPHILWLCSNREMFDAAREVACIPDHKQIKSTPKGTFKYYELPSVLDGADGISVWLFCPVDNSYESLLPKLLQCYNKSNYFLFTGFAAPASRHQRVRDSDICVIKPREPLYRPLIEELCHMTLRWDMNTEMKKPWQCSKVVFGTVGAGSVGGDVTSTVAASFCRASESLIKSGGGRAVPNAAILSVTQDYSKCYECGEPHIYHSVHYTYQVIKYLCEKKMLLDCFDH